MMRVVPAVILSFLLVPASGAFAETSLAPGKPAGLHNAQFEDGNGMFVVAGAALIGITVALATAGSGPSASGTSSGGSGGSTSTSTSTTGTTP